MKQIISIILISIASVLLVAQNTRRGTMVVEPEIEEGLTADTIVQDTIVAPLSSQIEVNGYDKPLRSRRETFFVTNNTEQAINSLVFTITYYDSKHRQLHSATHRAGVAIPTGQTRQLNLKSWDVQQQFYYSRSTVPLRTQQASPFDVTINIDTVFVDR